MVKIKLKHIYLTGWLLTSILLFIADLKLKKIEEEWDRYKKEYFRIKKKIEILEEKIIQNELLLIKIKLMFLPYTYYNYDLTGSP